MCTSRIVASAWGAWQCNSRDIKDDETAVGKLARHYTAPS
jgi:hypothetical protein